MPPQMTPACTHGVLDDHQQLQQLHPLCCMYLGLLVPLLASAAELNLHIGDNHNNLLSGFVSCLALHKHTAKPANKVRVHGVMFANDILHCM